MLARFVVLTLLISVLLVDATLPRLRPAKKAMRNSLVRFGKRADLVEPVYLGKSELFMREAFGPAESEELYDAINQARKPSPYFYF
ncbi:unnamed protein product [Nippostrongylus brasiliensis]|uniref:Uncharacterized protein n=1 Tax=Nippostrongylus brasiliensis TaxID=27835 RepID=A0A0N4XWC9_NIPBR|nr:unnamed protein product [Nippostrongylus brasiliensis]